MNSKDKKEGEERLEEYIQLVESYQIMKPILLRCGSCLSLQMVKGI